MCSGFLGSHLTDRLLQLAPPKFHIVRFVLFALFCLVVALRGGMFLSIHNGFGFGLLQVHRFQPNIFGELTECSVSARRFRWQTDST